MNKTKLLLLFSMIWLLLGLNGCTDSSTLLSPDKKLSVRFQLSSKGTPRYQLISGNKTVIMPSELGYVLDRLDLTRSLTLDSVTYRTVAQQEQHYDDLDAVTTGVMDGLVKVDSVWLLEPYNEMVAHMMHKSGLPVDLHFRLSNHSLAFRFEFKPKGEDRMSFLGRRMYTTAACIRLAVPPDAISVLKPDSISRIPRWHQLAFNGRINEDTIVAPFRLEWNHTHRYGAGHEPNDQRSSPEHHFYFTHPQYMYFDDPDDQLLSCYYYLDGEVHIQMEPTDHLLETTPWRVIKLERE